VLEKQPISAVSFVCVVVFDFGWYCVKILGQVDWSGVLVISPVYCSAIEIWLGMIYMGLGDGARWND
jgi:hypothetical protein